MAYALAGGALAVVALFTLYPAGYALVGSLYTLSPILPTIWRRSTRWQSQSGKWARRMVPVDMLRFYRSPRELHLEKERAPKGPFHASLLAWLT